jgi:hypothetical protein
MAWPLSQDYNEAVQDPRANFRDPELQAGQAMTNALGLPRPRSGTFADVYEIDCPATSTKWAVKCFTRQVPGLRDRYAAVSDHLRRARLPFTVDFTYLDEGIRVAGRWYPVLKMQWVEGLPLNDFVRTALDRPVMLQALGQVWQRMAGRLGEAGLAHADIQHGNVLLVPGSTPQSLAVKLIDYDGMWVPALADRPSGESGHPAYQHPRRLRERAYNRELDRFPLLVVATALRALAVRGRPLWERYDNGDNLLFREADLRAPRESPLFRELLGIEDPDARALVVALMHAAEGPLAKCRGAGLDRGRPRDRGKPAGTAPGATRLAARRNTGGGASAAARASGARRRNAPAGIPSKAALTWERGRPARIGGRDGRAPRRLALP